MNAFIHMGIYKCIHHVYIQMYTQATHTHNTCSHKPCVRILRYRVSTSDVTENSRPTIVYMGETRLEKFHYCRANCLERSASCSHPQPPQTIDCFRTGLYK